jgi:hypothetical protein
MGVLGGWGSQAIDVGRGSQVPDEDVNLAGGQTDGRLSCSAQLIRRCRRCVFY